MNNFKYKVTKTWYLTAEDIAEAISKSNQVLHQDVRAKKLDIIEDLFSTKGANENVANRSIPPLR